MGVRCDGADGPEGGAVQETPASFPGSEGSIILITVAVLSTNCRIVKVEDGPGDHDGLWRLQLLQGRAVRAQHSLLRKTQNSIYSSLFGALP